jgi:hypothetical protein
VKPLACARSTDKGVAPAAGDGTTALHRAAAGIRGPEASLEPRHGLILVGYQVSNVLNLVKYHLSFACKVYDANVRRIICPFSLTQPPHSPVSCIAQILAYRMISMP